MQGIGRPLGGKLAQLDGVCHLEGLYPWRMNPDSSPKKSALHWKVLIGMALGAAVGLVMQATLAAPAWIGASFESVSGGGVRAVSIRAGSPAAKAGLSEGSTWRLAVLNRGAEERGADDDVALVTPQDVQQALERTSNGEVIWFFPSREGQEQSGTWSKEEAGARPIAVAIEPDSPRDNWIYPFALVADVFIALLKMLIVPLVLASIVSGVAGVGGMKDLRRLGKKTFYYYMLTSLLAIMVGQVLVNVFVPGEGARLGLVMPDVVPEGGGLREFIEVVKRMVPPNIFSSLQDNGAMLSIIFFALVLGYSITRTPDPHGKRIREVFASFLEVMMSMAKGVLALLPYGVFALMVKVVATTGLAPFKALLLYMFVVTLALLVHAFVTLPLLLSFVAKVSPIKWAKAMAPALFTAFSTSSSSMTLPVTMDTVEHRGRVSNKVTSFTLPLGATVNMDGTALYECIGVIFLAQYYASVGGNPLGLGQQAFVVILALLASVGAAGIPSAGLVMMLTILAALRLPVEGAALLLAVDRPLDMLRTVVNVWSDTCAAAVVSRSEGEEGPLEPVVGA